MKIKPTQLYDWDSEPVDERPSEFNSTGWSSASGFYAMPPGTQTPPPSRFRLGGLRLVALVALGLLALGALVLAKLAPLLRA